jgi:glycerophosphoryl diester phosphodiesterase
MIGPLLTRIAAATGLLVAALVAGAPHTDAARARGCTLITAHRGQDGHHTENTIPSYRGAVAEGADALETDLRLTKDDHMVMMHDPKVDRTTNGTGRVDAKTLKQIRKLRTNDGGFVPTLAQVTARRLGGATLILEIKTNNAGWDKSSVRRLAALRHRHHYFRRTVAYSLSKPDLALVRRWAPRLETGLTVLRGPVTPGYVKSHADDVFPPPKMATRKWVKRMHRASVRVFARSAHMGPAGWAKLIVGRTRKQRPDSLSTDHVPHLVKWCSHG